MLQGLKCLQSLTGTPSTSTLYKANPLHSLTSYARTLCTSSVHYLVYSTDAIALSKLLNQSDVTDSKICRTPTTCVQTGQPPSSLAPAHALLNSQPYCQLQIDLRMVTEVVQCIHLQPACAYMQSVAFNKVDGASSSKFSPGSVMAMLLLGPPTLYSGV